MVDKMQRHDALKALDIYRRAGQQAERLSEFYEVCKSLDIGRGDGFIKIEQPPSSFIQAMEEYVKEAPRASSVRKDLSVDGKPKVILAIEHNKEAELQEKRPPSPPAEPKPKPKPEPEPEPVKVEAHLAERSPDLLGLDDPIQEVSELDQKNATALAIVPISDQPASTAATSIDGTAGWELALVTAPSSNESATASSKLAGGLDKLTLDSLYDDAVRRTNQNVSYNPWEQGPMPGSMMPPQTVADPFYASNMMAAPHNVQMAAMAQQQQAFMLQQQQQQQMMTPMMPQQGSNPFGNPYGDNPHPYNSGVPVQPYNQYNGLI